MTRFEQIKQMSVDEFAEKFIKTIKTLHINLVISTLDMTVHHSREEAFKYNKKWLEEKII